jgi:hypothetical protein
LVYILWLFGIYFPHFGTLYKEKSGNPAAERCQCENKWLSTFDLSAFQLSHFRS